MDALERDPAPAELLARAPQVRIVRRLARHSPTLSGVGASGKPGAVQYAPSGGLSKLSH